MSKKWTLNEVDVRKTNTYQLTLEPLSDQTITLFRIDPNYMYTIVISVYSNVEITLENLLKFTSKNIVPHRRRDLEFNIKSEISSKKCEYQVYTFDTFGNDSDTCVWEEMYLRLKNKGWFNQQIDLTCITTPKIELKIQDADFSYHLRYNRTKFCELLKESIHSQHPQHIPASTTIDWNIVF